MQNGASFHVIKDEEMKQGSTHSDGFTKMHPRAAMTYPERQPAILCIFGTSPANICALMAGRADAGSPDSGMARAGTALGVMRRLRWLAPIREELVVLRPILRSTSCEKVDCTTDALRAVCAALEMRCEAKTSTVMAKTADEGMREPDETAGVGEGRGCRVGRGEGGDCRGEDGMVVRGEREEETR